MIDGLLQWIGAALLGVLGWVVANFVAKPILDFRKDRMDALRVAERYAFSRATDQRADEIIKELNDASSALLVHPPGGSMVFRLYCKAMGYDLEQAARAMWGLAGLVGDYFPADDDRRRNTLNHVYVSLGAEKHLTAEERESYRRALESYSAASDDGGT